MSAKKATVLSKAKVQLGNVLQNRQLSKKRLLTLEAQRISNILKNCISQLEIAAILPAALQLNQASGVLDQELSRALSEHQILVDRLEMLEGLKQDLGGEQEEEAEEARKTTRAQLERDIKNSVRDLLRLIRAHPEAFYSLKAELDMEVGESEYMLIRGLETFHSMMVKKLLASPSEEIQLARKKQVSSSTAYDLERLVAQEAEIAAAMEEADVKISRKNCEIQEMQSLLKEKSREDVGPGTTCIDKQCQSLINISMIKQTSIQQDIAQQDTQLNNMILENRQAVRVLQEKNEKVETEIEYLYHTFDKDMEEVQANLELNEMNYGRELGELRELEKPFSVLEVECNQILEKRRLEEERRKQEMKELELKTKAAIFAQAWWRGHSTRKALKNKGKSKKAKKGKGKKAK